MDLEIYEITGLIYVDTPNILIYSNITEDEPAVCLNINILANENSDN